MCQAVDEMIEDGRREATVRILSGLVKDGSYLWRKQLAERGCQWKN